MSTLNLRLLRRREQPTVQLPLAHAPPTAARLCSLMEHPLPTILAFGFASPWSMWLLGGAAFGAIPIIVHLLHKRRYQETTWAAMRFLLEAARRNSRRIRLEQLILLTVRVLLLLLAAAALAQPYVESFGTYYQADVPVHRIIVIDASYSMGWQSADADRFERARQIALKIAASARQGDALNLVLISGSEPRAIVREPAFQHSRVVDEIEALTITQTRGDLRPSLGIIGELLQEAPQISRKEVCVISDFQKTTWFPADGSTVAALRSSLRSITGDAGLTLIDVGHSESPNVAVTDLSIQESLVAVGRPVSLQASFRNFGRSPLPDQLVELRIDGKLAATRRIDLPIEAEQTETFPFVFEGAGEHRVEVRLDGDGLELDNRRRLAVPVKEKVKVLLVNGRPSGRQREKATHYVQVVLSPSTDREGGVTFFEPTEIDESELPRHDLSRYDCVFLCNIALFDPLEAQLLRTYVEGGGGLVFCLGDQVRPESYNAMLYQGGEGVLPAELIGQVGDAGNPDDAYEFDPADLKHPIVNQFEGNPGTGLETTFALEYVKARLPEDGISRTVLKFLTGDPAIVERRVGRGRVLLVTTSLDNRWGPWPIQRSFLPIVHEMVKYVVAGQWNERQRLVGQPLTRAFPVRAFRIPVTLTRPDGRLQELSMQESEGLALLNYERADLSGFYEVQLGPPIGRTELFAVNLETGESDLAPLGEAGLQESLLSGVEFDYLTNWEQVDRGQEGNVIQRGGLTRWLLVALLILLFIEQLLAWNFAAGFLAMSVVVAITLSWQAYDWHPAAGVILGGVLAAGLAALVIRQRRRNPTGTGFLRSA